MFCSRCGRKNNDDKRFCVFCGTPLGDKNQAAGPGRPDAPAAVQESAPPVQPSAAAAPQAGEQGKGPGGRKSRKWTMIVVLSAIVVAAAIGLVLGITLTRGKPQEKEPGAKAQETGFAGPLDLKDVKSPTTEDLTSISALDETHVWAVGSSGTILFFDGSKWAAQDSGVTEQLNSVFAAGEDQVWAVGKGGVVLFFDGSGWKKNELGLSFTPDYLDSVFALDATHVWAAGGITGSQESVVLFYDGQKWADQKTPGAALHGVFAKAADDVWAIGNVGTAIHYDGQSWTSNNGGLKVEGKAMPYLWGIAGTAPDRIWATADSAIYLFDGQSWNRQSAGTKKLVCAETTGDNVWAVGSGGTLVALDGSSWKAQDTGTTADLFAIASTGETLWISGADGTLMKAKI